MSDDLHHTVKILAPGGGVVEVRALADGVTHSGYFDDYAALARAVEALDADPAVAGVYVTLNAANPALLARRANRIKMRLSRNDATTADADIIRRRWFPVDIDPARPSGVSSTDAEHDAALAAAERIAIWLAEQGFGEPIRADSGNGAHLLYRIDLENDEAATALVKGALATLDALFSNETITVDTANYNAARIWKLYGTVSRKGDNTPERPHRRAKILTVPDEIAIVPIDRLRHLAGLLPREESPRPKNTAGIDLAAWLAEHGIAVRSTRPWQGGTLYVLDECPFSAAHKDGAFAIQFANGAVFAGCHHATCGGGAQRWPELRGMYEPREKQKKKREVISRTEEEPTPPLLPPAPVPAEDEYRRRAFEVLQTGDPLAFLLDTFNKAHVGDRTVAECLVMSLASQSVENTNGLHVAVSGNSGKGKTHACTTMQNLIPDAYRLKGTVSDKALYYDDSLRPGTVLLFDDVSLSDDLQEVLKSATANFREPIEHRTLTTERKLRVCTIPERCVWWLAKVEDIGDDQVMNRMLTVWIDDTVEQDKRVLDHMKEAEAVGKSPAEDDILTCRAIWDVVKSEVLPVRIPFARRIQFSTTQNRRNPGMLFDLIKCRSRLFSRQRDRDDDGTVIARPEDFAAAAKLYSSLSGVAGGQETKLTKNEAAALATAAQMGVEVFTIRQLQSALGLSYYQTRRLLNGYVSRGTPYSGLLEKCPAISLYDATVTEDGGCGVTVRRREQYFTFDREVYRAWGGGVSVWLDDDPTSGSSAADVQQMYSNCCQQETGRNEGDSGNKGQDPDIDRSMYVHVQQNKRTESTDGGASGDDRGACVFRTAVHEPGNPVRRGEKSDPGSNVAALIGSTCCTYAANAASINPADYIALPVEKDEPCHVCGRRPTSSVRRGEGKYLCYDCLSKAKRPGKVQPLPGVLDHREFLRVKVELGRCDLCGTGKAVYRSREAQANICEGCYARLVRERNGRAGVR
ncbi:hypothetical protein [Methanoculleus sp.]|uniref:hypothetical protein n=1 Tax=Methanoculleus sp. TaxID=90427 RepID=UPI00320E5BBE